MNTKSITKKVISANKKQVISIVFLTVLSVFLKILVPLMIRSLIDNVVLTRVVKDWKVIWFPIFAITFSILAFVFDSSRNVKTNIIGQEIATNLSKETYSAVLHSELLEIKKMNNEEIIENIVNKTNRIGKTYVARNIIPMFYNSVLFVSLLITMITINYWFFALTFVSLPIYYFLIVHVRKMIKKRREKTHQELEEQRSILNENLTKIKSIKLLNGLAYEEEKYDKLMRRIVRDERRQESLETYEHNMLNSIIVDLILVGVVSIGSFLINRYVELQLLGSIVASLIIIPQIFYSFRQMMSYKIMPNTIKQEKTDIDELLSLKPENRADTVQQLDEIYSLKFKDVAYDYGQNSKFSLDEINFEIKKGEKLGILGLTGSGKTTIVDLLLKIIRPKQGNILINNCDINKINSYYLRDLISVVPQNFKMLDGTIEHNITYPLPFDEYKYNDALNRCKLKAFVSNLEKKDQTLIDDTSTILSNVDKQKIAIANALYKDGKIFVFDEATSKFDGSVENEIMSEIYKLKNKIILIISNRIYNLTKCDKILIINNGKILEYGKTSELLDDSKSTFAKMMKEYEQTKSRVS